jgi:hypothetical protein
MAQRICWRISSQGQPRVQGSASPVYTIQVWSLPYPKVSLSVRPSMLSLRDVEPFDNDFTNLVTLQLDRT